MLGKEVGCGNLPTKEVSSEFLNAPVTGEDCIPALQCFLGQAEEKVCRLFRAQKEGRTPPHTAQTLQG